MPPSDLFFGDATSTEELARRMDVPLPAVIGAGFERLGLLLTVDQQLDFAQVQELAAAFGVRARRRPSGEGDP